MTRSAIRPFLVGAGGVLVEDRLVAKSRNGFLVGAGGRAVSDFFLVAGALLVAGLAADFLLLVAAFFVLVWLVLGVVLVAPLGALLAANSAAIESTSPARAP